MAKKTASTYWIYGTHACMAALHNEQRTIRRVCVTQASYTEYADMLHGMACEVMDANRIARVLTADAVHQGIALEVVPLEQPDLEEILETEQPILVLDHVTDPHNVGAILRSAAAFDVAAVIVHDRHAPKESGVMAKSASGALELVPLISVVNLAQAMDEMKQYGYWCIGLDGYAEQSIADEKFIRKTALILGAEGKGMRRLTTERCDRLVKLPISDRMESLNVSNAAAIALYAMACRI